MNGIAKLKLGDLKGANEDKLIADELEKKQQTNFEKPNTKTLNKK